MIRAGAIITGRATLKTGKMAFRSPNIQPTEVLTLPKTTPGWRGLPIAEIKLAETPDGWAAASGVMLELCGYGSPLCHCAMFDSREAALRHEIGVVKDFAVSNKAPHVIEWADSLIPDQLDLFGAL